MSAVEVYRLAVGTLGAALAVMTALWWVARQRANGGRRLVLLVVGRALSALTKRGVPRARALDLVAPELKDALAKRGLKP